MEKERYAYLDLAKGIGMLMVIFCHVAQVIGVTDHFRILQNQIYAFHMPLFFIISGFLLAGTKKKWEDKIGKKALKVTKSLLIPYFFWNFLYLGILIGCGVGNVKMNVLSIVSGKGMPPLWFFSALWGGEMVYLLIGKVGKERSGLMKAAAAVLSVGGTFIAEPLISFVGAKSELLSLYFLLPLLRIFPTLFFLIMGDVFFNLYRNLREKRIIYLLPAGLALMGIMVLTETLTGSETDIYLMEFTHVYSMIITGVTGSYGLLLLCIFYTEKCPAFLQNMRWKPVESIGKRSLDLLVLHAPVFPWYMYGAAVMTKLGITGFKGTLLFQFIFVTLIVDCLSYYVIDGCRLRMLIRKTEK